MSYDPNPFEDKKKELVNKIEKEYGSVKNFVALVTKWFDEVPERHLQANPALRVIKEKGMDMSDPSTMAVMYRKVTSIDHVRWIDGVLERIQKMKQEIQNTNLPPLSSRADSFDETNARKQFSRGKKSAIEFIDDVKEQTEGKLRITEDQMQKLNEIYKRYKKL